MHSERVDYVCAESVKRFREQVVDSNDGGGGSLEELSEAVVNITGVDVSHETRGTFEVPFVGLEVDLNGLQIEWSLILS